MTVYLANYPVPDNATAYSEQRDKILAAIQTFGEEFGSIGCDEGGQSEKDQANDPSAVSECERKT